MTGIMRETSLEAFADILSDGTLGDSHKKAYDLVVNYPNSTVKELLRYGVNDGIYPHEDRNLIAPRITDMVNNGLIIRPKKRRCGITGKSAFENHLAPIEWINKCNQLKRYTRGKIVKNRLEIESKTTEGVFHTVIEWHDGTFYCSCNIFYKRPVRLTCHHINGMKLSRGDNQ